MTNGKIKILLVDDDNDIRSMYAEVFKSQGFEVEEAIDGLDGFEKATQIIPDVIFTGIIMPRMDGFSLKENLSKHVATVNIPVIMSSHMGRKVDEDRAKELGIKDFIVRDMVSPKQAVERIRRVFSSGDYRIKFDLNSLDAPRLAQDMKLSGGFQCADCGAEMVLSLGASSLNSHEFSAKLICPNCQKQA